MDIAEAFDIPADLDAVWAALADPGFHAARAEANRAVGHACQVAGGSPSGPLTVTNRWELPVDGLPAAARALVGPALVLHEVQRWTREPDGAVGTLDLRLERADAQFLGQSTVVPHRSGTRQRVTGVVTSSLPFLGAQVVATAGPVVRAAVRAEAATAAAWFSSR